ncbi:MAG: hypothetical protein QOI71_3982 [Gaiellales bacterium]|jgi:hypothetical protein|nr:hypothetical protein [Gaiellales bacterium]
MVARVARHEGGDTERLRAMNEQRMTDGGGLGLPDGCRRAMLLAGDGHRLFVTFFDDAAAAALAESQFEAMGEEYPEEVRGRRASVEVYDVAIDEET